MTDDRIAPGFLIAVPQLQDPNFHLSVVLLLQKNDEGALGLVINRQTPMLLKDLCERNSIRYAGRPDKTIRMGGPVQPEQGLVLYGDEHASDPEGRRVAEGLHVSASTGTLSRLCTLSEGRFQCYAGYAGWGPGQLEKEIAEGAWILAPPNPMLVLDTDPDTIWEASLRGMGIDPAAIVPGGAES
jgi:putative transcriptional regulator